jgi:hypothetical protein
MTAADLTAQLRAAKPVAPAHLRERVQAIARTEPASAFRARLRLPRLRVVLPVTAGFAVAAAAAIAFVHPGGQSPGVESARPLTPPTTQLGSIQTTPSGSAAGTDQAAPSPTAPAFKAAPTQSLAPPIGRATRYAAQLTITVKNGNALSDATTRAQNIARDLDGYVVNVSFASADSGNASLTLRVPTAQVQTALSRLAALGRVTGQQVQIDDLQATLDQLDRRVAVLRARIAHITALLADPTLTAVKRTDLESQRTDLQSALRSTHQNRASTAQEARFATIQLQLLTAAKAIAPPPSRASRILHQAGRILAWEGAAVLYVLVVAGPLALLVAALAFASRARRRGEETRLLARG